MTTDQRPAASPIAIVVAVFGLALAFALMGRQEPTHALAVPTPALQPIYIIATPPAPTPDQALQRELAALRARVEELETRRLSTTVDNAPASLPALEIAVSMPEAQPTFAPPTPAPAVDCAAQPTIECFGGDEQLLRVAMDQ